jgi:endonuclease G
VKYIFGIILLLASGATFACEIDTPITGVTECKYQRYTAWISCKDKANLMSWFELGIDNGSEDTSDRSYKIDPNQNLGTCQQTSKKTYVHGYDVGHIAAINHFDESKAAALETNFMTNLLPQALKTNRYGAWRQSEKMTECYRDEGDYPPINVLVGAIYGNDETNDIFKESHGLRRTPDFFWKVVHSTNNNKYDAWVIPNLDSAIAQKLPEYRKSLTEIIFLLRAEGERVYLPVINRITTLQVNSPIRIEMKNNPRCGGRNS